MVVRKPPFNTKDTRINVNVASGGADKLVAMEITQMFKRCQLSVVSNNDIRHEY